MAGPREPLFVARDSYRRRRLLDAARLAPALGLVLLLVPVLWSAGTRTSGGLVYVFSVWALLILVIGLMSRRLKAAMSADARAEDAGEPEG